jgi:cytochrome b-561 domain-containing protein 2
MEKLKNSEKIEFAINTLNHSCIFITTFYLTWYCFHVGFDALITYHVFFTTIGYQLLMAEGILAMYKQNTFSLLAKTKADKTLLHWILQAIGGLCALAGIIIQIISRYRLGKPHFSLIHSIIGIEIFIT